MIPDGSSNTTTTDDWVRQLFRVSVQKQEKLHAISVLLGDVAGQTCLDVGGDNGVISRLLRERGGTWHSVDLDEASVSAIRKVVGERVHQLDGTSLPFGDATFDTVVVVDLLEHLHDDRAFVRDIARVLAPGGRLIVNVPARREESVLYRLRERLGIGDEEHGHVRPGYTLDELARLLSPEFRIEASTGYSHLPLEGLDVLMNAAYALSRRGGEPDWGEESDKGALVTGSEWRRHRRKFRVLRLLRPVFALVRFVDRHTPGLTPYKHVVRASRAGAESPDPRVRRSGHR